jgi:hypothetical protein
MLGYGGSSQGASSAGSYIITPNGVTSENYSLKFVDGVLIMLVAPPPAPTPTPTPTPTSVPVPVPVPVPAAEAVAKSAATADAPSVGAGASNGVNITVATQPTRFETGFVAVSLPKGTATEGAGFRVPLPPEVASPPSTVPMQVNSAAAAAPVPVIDVRAIINGRALPLPGWLRYSPEEQMFVATAVPDGSLPITIEIVVAGQRTLIVISERLN